MARETNIKAHNLVVGSAGQASLAVIVGGTYNFTHCTFANFWNNGIRQLPAVLVNNFFVYENASGQEITETRDLKAANFTNCIFDGNNNIEFLLDKVDGSLFNYNIQNCMISFTDANKSFAGNAEMKFTDNPNYKNIILNSLPDFRNTQNEDFIIGENSGGINKAMSSRFLFDILGKNRTNSPDIGAFQHIIFD